MGKKRIITTNQEELIKETEKIQKKMNREVSAKSTVSSGKGRIFISSTYNNTIISLTNENGDVLAWKSAGSIGFKGTKKGTSYASSQVAKAVVGVCEKFRISKLDIYIKGVGGGRDTALKTFSIPQFEIESIHDTTPIPHNGCRPKKPRRV